VVSYIKESLCFVSVIRTKARLLRDYHQVDCHSSSTQTNIMRKEVIMYTRNNLVLNNTKVFTLRRIQDLSKFCLDRIPLFKAPPTCFSAIYARRFVFMVEI